MLSDSSTNVSSPAKLRIIAAAFFIAACVFYGQIADALTLQGDADFAAGRGSHAVAAYSRAVFFDPQSSVAVARYNTAAYFYGDARVRRDALHYGRLILARETNDAPLLIAMGLNALRLGDDYTAANIYVRLGILRRDARYLVIAGYALHRVDADPLARKTFALALKMSPRNPSALQGLRRLPERA